MQKVGVCQSFTLSFILVCQTSDLCFSTSVYSASEFFCLSQGLPCLTPKTLYLFARNPRGFCPKPYTLLLETHEGFAIEIVTGRRSAGCWQAVCRADPGRVCPFFVASSAISVFASMQETYCWRVRVRVKCALEYWVQKAPKRNDFWE